MKRIYIVLIACALCAAAGAFSLKPLALSCIEKSLKEQFQTDDVRISGFRLDLRGAGFSRLEARKYPSLELTAEDAELGFDGRFSVARAAYRKLSVTDIRGVVRLEKDVLHVFPVSANLLDGRVEGELKLLLSRGGGYEAQLRFTGLSLERYDRDFELQEKVELSGRMNGSVTVRGRGKELEELAGSFTGEKDGGTLTVKDMSFLENIATRSRQPVEMLADGFRDYRYDRASVTLSLDRGSLSLNADMDGNKGKRNLTLVVHDFQPQKEAR